LFNAHFVRNITRQVPASLAVSYAFVRYRQLIADFFFQYNLAVLVLLVRCVFSFVNHPPVADGIFQLHTHTPFTE